MMAVGLAVGVARIEIWRGVESVFFPMVLEHPDEAIYERKGGSSHR